MGYELTNNSAKIRSGVELKIDLPDQITYVSGSASMMTEIDISDLNSPVFLVNDLMPGSGILISFSIHTNCSIYDEIQSGMDFENQLTFQHPDFNFTYKSETYAVDPGLLVITEFNDITETTNTTFTRQVEITNGRLGRISEFTYENNHEDVILTSSNGTVIDQTGTYLQLRLDGDDFEQIGNGDRYFDLDEAIVIEETITHEKCENEILNSEVIVSWGCDNAFCQSDTAYAEIRLIPTRGNARLQTSAEGDFPSCPCLPEGYEQCIKIENIGDEATENLMVVLDIAPIISISEGGLRGSIAIDSGDAQILEIVYDTLRLFDCSDSIMVFTQAKVTISDIEPGQSIKLCFRFLACYERFPISNNGTAQFQWEYDYQFDTRCKPFSNVLVRDNRVRMLGEVAELDFRFLTDSTPSGGILYEDSVYTLKWITRGDVLQDSGRWLIEACLPCGMSPIGDVTFSSNENIVSQFVERTDSTTFIQYIIEAPFQADSLVACLDVEIDCEAQCVKDLGVPQNLIFDSSCPFDRNRYSDYSCQVNAYQTFSTCPDSFTCGFDKIFFALVDYGCAESIAYDTVGAYMIFDGGVERLSIGQEDNDDNRFKGTDLMDSSLLRRDRMVVGDTLLIEFGGSAVIDDATKTWDSLQLLISAIGQFEYLGTEFTFVDFETGQIFNCQIDSFRIAMEPGVVPGPCDLVVSRRPVSGFSIDITPDFLEAVGCPFPNFELTQGDSVYVRSRIVNYNHSNRITDIPLSLRTFLFDRSDDEHVIFSCSEVSELLELSGYSAALFAYDDLLVDVCGSTQSSGSWRLIPTSDILNNFFVNEFRQLIEISEMVISVPELYEVDSVEVRCLIKAMSPVVTPIDTVIFVFGVEKNGNNYAVNLSDLERIEMDEIFELDILPFIKLKDCRLGPTGARDFARIKLTVTGHDNFYFSVSTFPNNVFKSYTFQGIDYQREIVIPYPEILVEGGNPTITADKREFCRSVQVNFSESVDYFSLDNRIYKDNNATFRLSERSGLVLQEIDHGHFIGLNVPPGEYFFDLCIISELCEHDSLDMNVSWACTSGDSIEQVCYDTTFNFEILKRNAEMELDIASEEAVKLCDTTDYIFATILNGDLGRAYDVKLYMTLPTGLSFIPGEMEYRYPSNNSWRALSLPDLVSGNQYVWNLGSYISTGDSSLVGIDSVPNNKFDIRLRLLTDCDLGVGKTISFWTTGMSPCGQMTNTVRKTTRPFRIEGLTQGFQSELNIVTEQDNCGDDVLLRMEISTNLMTMGDEVLEILVPKPLFYDSLSMVAIENIMQQEPVIETMSNFCLLKFNLDQSINQDERIIFEFLLSGLKELACGEYELTASILSTGEALCVSTNMPCETVIENGSALIEIEKNGLNVEIDKFEIIDSLLGDFAKLFLSVPGVVDSSGVEGDVTIYDDVNRNANLDSSDILIENTSLSYDIDGDGKAMICLPLEQGMVNCAWIAIIDGGCICAPDTAYFERDDITEYFITDTLCFGDSITIGAIISPGLDFMWRSNGPLCDTCRFQVVVGENQTDSIIKLEYIEEVFSTESCGERYIYEINLLPKPPIFMDTLIVCPGEEVILRSARVSDWKGPNFNVEDQIEIRLTANNSDIYTARYEDDFGCLIYHDFYVDVLEVVSAYEIIADTTIRPGDSVQLWVEPIPDSITWQPDYKLSCINCPSPWASPDTSTTYTATVYDTNGCPLILSVRVSTVVPPCSTTVYVPNAFSPNGDKINDQWFVKGRDLQDFHVVVYNRWGEEVYESFDPGKGWDGTFAGEFLKPDVFAYAIWLTCVDDDEIFLKGNMTLLR